MIDSAQLVVTSLPPAHGEEAGVDDVVFDSAAASGCEVFVQPTVFAIGSTEYRSVAALQRLPDFAEWEPAVRAELEYAFKKK